MQTVSNPKETNINTTEHTYNSTLMQNRLELKRNSTQIPQPAGQPEHPPSPSSSPTIPNLSNSLNPYIPSPNHHNYSNKNNEYHLATKQNSRVYLASSSDYDQNQSQMSLSFVEAKTCSQGSEGSDQEREMGGIADKGVGRIKKNWGNWKARQYMSGGMDAIQTQRPVKSKFKKSLKITIDDEFDAVPIKKESYWTYQPILISDPETLTQNQITYPNNPSIHNNRETSTNKSKQENIHSPKNSKTKKNTLRPYFQHFQNKSNHTQTAPTTPHNRNVHVNLLSSPRHRHKLSVQSIHLRPNNQININVLREDLEIEGKRKEMEKNNRIRLQERAKARLQESRTLSYSSKYAVSAECQTLNDRLHPARKVLHCLKDQDRLRKSGIKDMVQELTVIKRYLDSQQISDIINQLAVMGVPEKQWCKKLLDIAYHRNKWQLQKQQ